MGWIKTRGVNGEWGYLNTETGEFSTTLPTQGSTYSNARLVAQQNHENRARSKADVAAERAIRLRQERRQGVRTAESESRNRTLYNVAKEHSKDSHVGEYIASTIDGAMIGLSMTPTPLRFAGDLYWGLRGAKAASQGNYGEAALMALPYEAALAKATKPWVDLGTNMLRFRFANPKLQGLPNNFGWMPKLSIDVVHASKSEKPLTLFNDARWDVVNEGANPHGVWYQGKWGEPRTELTNPGKGEKAQKARDLFATRPYIHEGTLTLEKPMGTVGEVPNRSLLSWYADKAGADGLVYNNVYDNGYNNNLVILSFKLHNPTFTDDLIKLLGDSYKGPDGKALNREARAMELYFKSIGVDVSKFGSRDYLSLMMKRYNSLSHPDYRHGLVYDGAGPASIQSEISLYKGPERIGEISTKQIKADGAKNNIENTLREKETQERGVMLDLYDVAIENAHQNGLPGIVSGAELKSPEITTYLWTKYPDKELVGNYGTHTYNFGRDIADGGEVIEKTHQPVYQLTQPTKLIPIKSATLFHPSLIDKSTWTLKAPDWSKKSKYLSLPLLLGGYGLSQ